ncbi:MAG: SDR family NAD(P)-dependent oxidoreductase [Candidatus Hydrogenedens sp.]|nr:SDR family NAD(P)-dependent oxidoreductase [Candidatus Hydrogenedens sp.]
MSKTLSERYPGAALITGASAGLGEAFARRCAAEGMDLILVARRAERLEELAAELQKAHGIRAHAVPQDLQEPDCHEKLKASCDELGLRVSMLINNAGFGSHDLFHKVDIETQLRMIDVNCRAPVALTGVFLPSMLERGNGAVVFLASTAAYQPTPWFATYGATKTFDLMLGEALWAETRGTGVDVIAVSPGYTLTEFQAVADVRALPPKALWAKPEAVVNTCFANLGKKPSAIDGTLNAIAAFLPRINSRKTVAALAKGMLKPER